MRKYHSISAFLFLFVFGVYSLHQLLPHVHHIAEQNAPASHHHEATHAHTHASEGHHHHDTDAEDDNGLLGGLLDDHMHTLESFDFTIVPGIKKQPTEADLDTKDAVKSTVLSQSDWLSHKWRFWDQPPQFGYQQVCFASPPHRGPPILG